MSGRTRRRATGRKPTSVRRQSGKTDGAFGKETAARVVTGAANRNRDKESRARTKRALPTSDSGWLLRNGEPCTRRRVWRTRKPTGRAASKPIWRKTKRKRWRNLCGSTSRRPTCPPRLQRRMRTSKMPRKVKSSGVETGNRKISLRRAIWELPPGRQARSGAAAARLETADNGLVPDGRWWSAGKARRSPDSARPAAAPRPAPLGEKRKAQHPSHG